MKILIVAATMFEVRPLLDHFAFIRKEDETLSNYQFRNVAVDLLVTGIGMTATAFHLGKQLAGKSYDLVINAGICGSFTRDIPVGKVVEITEENFCELGAESDDKFLTLFDLGLVDPDDPPFHAGKLVNTTVTASSALSDLRKVRGTTANTIHGNPETIRKISELFQPKVESMEGAAVFYACLIASVPFHQIRSISNYVEERDKSKWDIPLALANLNGVLLKLLREMTS
ncbi:MAG: futalosine hydrolase [Bacteroidetes bacterium]|nr:futalosine hydrolase [Bacteroidota bacterium]